MCPLLRSRHNLQSAKADLSLGHPTDLHNASMNALFWGVITLGGDNAGIDWKYRETLLSIDAGPSGMTRMGYCEVRSGYPQRLRRAFLRPKILGEEAWKTSGGTFGTESEC